MRTPVSFINSAGARLKAWLYHDLIDAGIRFPAIVMAHDAEPSNACDIDDCAMTLQTAGFVVLVYGDSTADHLHEALAFVRSLDFIDPRRVSALAGAGHELRRTTPSSPTHSLSGRPGAGPANARQCP